MAIVVLTIILFFLAMTTVNLLSAFKLDQVTANQDGPFPLVSVLIPARNETQNLPHLIPSLLSSQYQNFEILVLDDESSDQTYELAEKLLAESSTPHQVFRGNPWHVKFGLSGKNYACVQLAEKANGEILIFCDADVTISPTTIARTLTMLNLHPKASGISGLAQLKASGFLEQMVLPWIMQIPIMISLPLRFAWQWPVPSMQIANGQWLAIRKKNYEILGGHRALGFSILEDVQMAKKLTEKSLGGIIPVIASRDVSVRMYSNWKTMVDGFSKNLVLIYGGNSVNFVILLAMTNFIFFYPLLGLFVAPSFAATALAAILILRLGIGLAFGNGFWPTVKQLILFWPSLLALNYFSFHVLKNISEKKTDWKGRKIYLPENIS
jgi:chlorobactene glucosyltransferase